jgi:hypothetical protein
LTVATIHKVVPHNGVFRSIVVNIFVLGRTSKTKQFKQQVIDIKKLIKAFQPREVIIDINGLGAGV